AAQARVTRVASASTSRCRRHTRSSQASVTERTRKRTLARLSDRASTLAQARAPRYPLRVSDCLIVGGGMVGCAIALALRDRGLGRPVERWSGRDLAAVEPALAPATLALRIPEGHQVDTRRAMRALVFAAASAGVDFVRAEVRAIRHDGGRTSGVETNHGPRD